MVQSFKNLEIWPRRLVQNLPGKQTLADNEVRSAVNIITIKETNGSFYVIESAIQNKELSVQGSIFICIYILTVKIKAEFALILISLNHPHCLSRNFNIGNKYVVTNYSITLP